MENINIKQTNVVEITEDPMDLSEGKSAIMKTFGRTLIDGRGKNIPGVARPKCDCPFYVVKDLQGVIISSFALDTTNNGISRTDREMADEIDKNIAKIIINRLGLTVKNITDPSTMGGVRNQVSSKGYVIATINHAVYPGSSFEKAFLEKLIDSADFRNKINSKPPNEEINNNGYTVEQKLMSIPAKELLEIGDGVLFNQIHKNRTTVSDSVMLLFKAKLMELYGKEGYNGALLTNPIEPSGGRVFKTTTRNGKTMTIFFGE